MEIRYNVTGDRRKALVKVISETTGARAVYKFMPTCAYEIDYFTVDKEGTLSFSDRSDTEEVERVLEAVATAGFECEQREGFEEESESPDAALTEGDSTPTAAEPESEADGDSLTISMPLDGFSPESLDRLTKLIDSKAKLIQKALGAARLTVGFDTEKVSFPWFDRVPSPEEISAYTAFIAALCRMAKESVRVTATEKEVESEKYAFRGFLLRLGFIGTDSKEHRKILMKNLSGSAAFPNKAAADAFSAAQKAKRDAAKEVQT